MNHPSTDLLSLFQAKKARAIAKSKNSRVKAKAKPSAKTHGKKRKGQKSPESNDDDNDEDVDGDDDADGNDKGDHKGGDGPEVPVVADPGPAAQGGDSS